MSAKEWLQDINLWQVGFFLFIVYLLIRQLLSFWSPLRKFVAFVDTMQSLPHFIETTNNRFLVLFEHLEIDPKEADKYKETGNGSK